MNNRFDATMAHAAGHIRVLAAVAPKRAAEDSERMARELLRGETPVPNWSYDRAPVGDVPSLLRELRHEALRVLGEPWAALYLERIAELEHECALIQAVGTRDFSSLASSRYAPVNSGCTSEALVLAQSWLPLTPERRGNALPCDARDPSSLLSRLRAEVGRRRVAFRVVPTPSLSSLAATGDDTIFVSTTQRADEEDVERTVRHEMDGHVMPRVRAQIIGIPLLMVGTAKGIDQQEGLALLLEERHGHFKPRRQRELAARHCGVHWMLDGATFGETAKRLNIDFGFEVHEAIRIAERAYRGGDGTSPGLGRERVYLESLIDVRACIESDPTNEAVLASGQISVAAVGVLRQALEPR